MLVDTPSAVKRFFSNTSFEWVYFEAIANAIDANAKTITVNIQIDELSVPGSLTLEIIDDGCGFNNKRFEKFTHLLRTEAENRKGLGRLVYLNYFKQVEVTSVFDKIKREFIFDANFNGRKTDTQLSEAVKSYTSLKFSGYNRIKVAKQQYLLPSHLVEITRRQFYPAFLTANTKKEPLTIQFNLKHGTGASFAGEELLSVTLTSNEFPATKEIPIEIPGFDNLFPFKLRYSIQATKGKSLVHTFVVVDERTIELDIVSKTRLPSEYCIVFLLEGQALQGKTDNSRISLDITPGQLKSIKNAYLKGVRSIFEKEFPTIKQENERRIKDTEEKYPHLKGYFTKDEVGLLDKNKYLESAEKRFFQDQRSVFEAQDMTDENFEKSIIQSSRILTQYILYRTKIIDKLRSIKKTDTEYTIHDLLVPRKKIFQSENRVSDVFANNAWVIDDKFMNYRTILSDLELKQIYPELGVNSESNENGRPDITVICSSPFEAEGKVDVVIVELKKFGAGENKNTEAASQLRQRARKLLEYQPSKIQRIWFYAIVDFDKDFIKYLKETRHVNLYSNGSVYYQEYSILIDVDDKEEERIAQVFIMDYRALIEDASARNSCFLEILKTGLNGFEEEESISSEIEDLLEEVQADELPQEIPTETDDIITRTLSHDQ